MKKLCFIITLLLVLIMTGCGNSKESTVSTNNAAAGDKDTAGTAVNDQYGITTATYTEQNIKISYPQISNYHDSSKQQTINELVKTSIIKVLDNYQDDLSSLDMNIDYEIKYQGSNLLSIEYLGLAAVKETVYPVNLIWTTNIDLEKKKELTLSTVVKINDSLVEKFKAGQYTAYSSDLDMEAAGALQDTLDGFSSQDLLGYFKEQTAKFYVTKNSLGISVEVGHVVGDHLEMEMPYTDLGELLLLKPQGLADLSSNHTLNTSAGKTAATVSDIRANSEITKEKAADILTAYLQTTGDYSAISSWALDQCQQG